MANKTYTVRAVWDDEAKVWTCESDIIGLHVEAKTLEEFESLVDEFAAELIATNHLTEAEINSSSIRDLIPAIRMREPKAA